MRRTASWRQRPSGAVVSVPLLLRGAAGKVPVFDILEREGRVFVEVIPNVQAETLLGMLVKKVRRGSIVYTARYRSYDSLMVCGYRHLRIDLRRHFAQGRVYINGLEGFWSFATIIAIRTSSRFWQNASVI